MSRVFFNFNKFFKILVNKLLLAKSVFFTHLFKKFLTIFKKDDVFKNNLTFMMDKI